MSAPRLWPKRANGSCTRADTAGPRRLITSSMDVSGDSLIRDSRPGRVIPTRSIHGGEQRGPAGVDGGSSTGVGQAPLCWMRTGSLGEAPAPAWGRHTRVICPTWSAALRQFVNQASSVRSRISASSAARRQGTSLASSTISQSWRSRRVKNRYPMTKSTTENPQSRAMPPQPCPVVSGSSPNAQ